MEQCKNLIRVNYSQSKDVEEFFVESIILFDKIAPFSCIARLKCANIKIYSMKG